MKDRTGNERKTVPARSDRQRQAVQFSTLIPGYVFDGRYRIIRSLGAGGMGEVFFAQDQFAGAEVALKVLYPRRGPEGVLRRLRRELEIVRSLDHPGIVRIHHLGEAQGLFYLVMELLRGTSLRERIDRGPIPADQTVAILETIAESLAVAHRSGVVHRDIKPDNVFLEKSSEGEGERVVLLDFGIALREGDARLTATGDTLGTPHYLAPEQARGETEIGPAADVYALGALTWEMLSGKPVFHGENAMQIIQAHLSQDVPANPEFPHETPAWLARLVKRMLAKKRTDRPPDGAAVLSMIRRRHVPRMTARTGRLAGIIAASALVIAVAAYALIDFSDRAPAGVRSASDGRYVGIVDPEGEAIEGWNERISAVIGRDAMPDDSMIREVTKATVLDASAWPATKLAVAASSSGPPWSCTLHLLDGRSRELEAELVVPFLGHDRRVPTRLRIEDGDVLEVDFQPLTLSAAEFNGIPGDEILLSAGSSRSYPTQVLALERTADWTTLLDHWNMGNAWASAIDLDEDGTDEIVLYGANNAFQEAWITILDPGDGSSSVVTQSPPGRRQVRLLDLEDYPVGGLTIRFPRVVVSRAMGSPFRFIRGRSLSVDWDDEARRLRVEIRDGTTEAGRNNAYSMAYILDLQTGSVQVEWTDYDDYLARFQEYYGRERDPWGVVEQESLRPYDPVLIGEILQWDGEAGDQQWQPFDITGLVERFRPTSP